MSLLLYQMILLSIKKQKIVAAILYVRNMTLNDDVVSTIEKKNLLTVLASYPYRETLTKKFLVFTGLRS